MNRNLILLGFAITAIGIVGASFTSAVATDATIRWTQECFGFNPPPQCSGHLSTMSTYGALTSIFQAMIVLGLFLVIILVLLEYIQTHPAPALQPAMPPPAAACPRCGRPLRWIPQYGRWYCDGCAAYV